MADYAADRIIYLQNFSPDPSGTVATWTGSFELPQDTTVKDVAGAGAGVLTTDDWMNTTSITYSGYYVEIDGQNYGIFQSGSFGLIPYNAAAVGGSLSVGDTTATTLHLEALENAANCFLAGTHIATTRGEKPVERLQRGERVLMPDGTATPVLWTWRQEVVNVHGLNERTAPIRIAAHALGPGCPKRDLIVTPEHALLVDGFLVNACALVNDSTIAPVPMAKMPARFAYWHVETAAHVTLLAEGCPAESFIDYTPRDGFDNYAEYIAQGGADRFIAEMTLPRISTQRLLPPHLRQRLGIGRAA
jgi:hypothetical protein